MKDELESHILGLGQVAQGAHNAKSLLPMHRKILSDVEAISKRSLSSVSVCFHIPDL